MNIATNTRSVVELSRHHRVSVPAKFTSTPGINAINRSEAGMRNFTASAYVKDVELEPVLNRDGQLPTSLAEVAQKTESHSVSDKTPCFGMTFLSLFTFERLALASFVDGRLQPSAKPLR